MRRVRELNMKEEDKENDQNDKYEGKEKEWGGWMKW